MDVKILIKQAKARFNHNSSKAYLKDKYEAKLLVANQGGLWKATPELLTFLDSAMSESIILLDNYGHPVTVPNRQELFEKVRSTYNEVMQEWANELKELENNR